MTTLNEDLIYEILSAVEEIPAGKVASYGQIARLIGKDRNARLVGKVLSISDYYGEYPCHRVAAGRSTAESLGGQDRQKGSSEWNREFCSTVSLWTRNF